MESAPTSADALLSTTTPSRVARGGLAFNVELPTSPAVRPSPRLTRLTTPRTPRTPHADGDTNGLAAAASATNGLCDENEKPQLTAEDLMRKLSDAANRRRSFYDTRKEKIDQELAKVRDILRRQKEEEDALRKKLDEDLAAKSENRDSLLKKKIGRVNDLLASARKRKEEVEKTQKELLDLSLQRVEKNAANRDSLFESLKERVREHEKHAEKVRARKSERLSLSAFGADLDASSSAAGDASSGACAPTPMDVDSPRAARLAPPVVHSPFKPLPGSFN